jgi:hypothetical protein
MDLIQAEIAKLEAELMTDHCDIDTAITQIMNDITTINNNVININTDISVINTNVTNIDASLTLIENDITIINENINTTNIFNNITNINIAVNFTTYTTNSLDTTNTEAIARYNAFCVAMVDWVCSACAKYGQIFQYSLADYFDVLEAVEKSLTFFDPFIALTAMPANSDIIDIIGESRAETAVANSAAINEIACAMAEYLQYLEPSQATFAAALEAWVAANPTPTPPPPAPSGWTDSQVIGAMCAAALSRNGAYQAWASLSNYWFEAVLATQPTEYICLPCGTPLTFCSRPQDFFFNQGNLPPWIITRGLLVPGIGIEGTQIPGDLNFGIDIEIQFDPPCTALNTHSMEIGHALKVAGGNAWTVEFYYLNAGVETRYNQSNRSQGNAWPLIDADAFAIQTPPGGTGVGISKIRFYTNTSYYANPTSHASEFSVIEYIKFL